MDLKETINSILKDGERSPHLNCFVELCVAAAVSCLNNSKFKKEIMLNMDHSVEDIAVDLIGDLFKTENNKFVYFERYFSGTDVIGTENDVLKAKLFSLIYSRSSQRISRIRIEFGEIFFNIEKAVNEEIRRHPESYKQITICGKPFIYTCKDRELDTNATQCSEETILFHLFGKRFKTLGIPEILKCIFEFLNSQIDYLKAYEKTGLSSLITTFHRRRNDCSNSHFMGY